ncbi:MAG: ABC transporter permease [Armatimonadota bacterium]
MGIIDAIRTGLSELWLHKLRSALTMLGVIFGVAAVIAMVSIGEGAKQETLEQIKQMGIDVVHVQRAVIAGELLEKAQERSPYGLKFGDAENLHDVMSLAIRVIPAREVFADVKIGEKPVSVKVVGTIPGYEEATRSIVERRRFLRWIDISESRPVCVLGAAAKRDLFGFDDPIGKTIKIGMRKFRVVGQIQAKEIGAAKAFAALRDLNSDVYIPITISMTDFQIFTQQAVPATMQTLREMYHRMRSRQVR